MSVVAVSVRKSVGSWGRRLEFWYAAFAVHAGAVAVFSGPGQDRIWGIWAVCGYAIATPLAARRHATAALGASLLGALVGPVVWLATTAPPTPDVQVVARAAALALHHGTPYLSGGQLTSVIAYNPYLPLMSVFGLPSAVGVPGVPGDPRVWLALATVVLLAVAFRLVGRADAMRCALFALGSSVLAFPLALGITDPPMLALLCLTAALLGRGKLWPAAVALGVACAMKATAWPALPVFAAMLVARDGARNATRFAAIAAAVTVGLVAVCAPAALGDPSALVQNTILFPLGLTQARTPAASPLPGHLLASTGPVGHLAAIGILVVVGLGYAVSLVTRPPAGGPAAIRRLAVGLTLLFALAPATRFGYFAYPIGLFGWLGLSHVRSPLASDYWETLDGST
ncbi:MAG TPA: glycosyltransferase 87 family protein [Pseudonocardiaceae bacterium]